MHAEPEVCKPDAQPASQPEPAAECIPARQGEQEEAPVAAEKPAEQTEHNVALP